MNNKEHAAIIAENIKSNLERLHLSQKDFAEAIGIAPSTLTDYLKLRTRPSHGVIQKMADYFEIEKSDLDTSYKSTNSDLALSIESAKSFEGRELTNTSRTAIRGLIRNFLDALVKNEA